VNLLLDTHVLLWWLEDNPTLSLEARSAIADPNNIVFVSAVSAWEITIKKALGKLAAPDNLAEEITNNRFLPLPITISHALAVGNLPPIHQDPFDRLLAAQASVEKLTLLTRNDNLKHYSIPFISA
jgi:PIN domain nuclease of toxin-antitoxin system